MALLGYARVSTSHQKLTAQIMELKSSGVRDDRIFTDMMSGATDEREGLQRHCCKVSDEAAFCLIQRPYISKTLLTRRISPRG
ncbi:MAG: recombinase family protein, partial [Klebsiella michiganensis]|nr:recombinase family protein [Klebsiella michiganensis]